MSAEPALLSAVRDRPDDDTPRLAYADWLDDGGDAARAEFVRVQVALARLPDAHPDRPALEDREHDLLAAHEPAWLGVPADAVFEWEWERGFLNEVACGPAALLDHGPDLFARHPVRRWRVLQTEGVHDDRFPAAGRTRGDHLEAIDLTAVGQPLAGVGPFLAAHPYPRLRELALADRDGHNPGGQFTALPDLFSRCGFRGQLTRVRLDEIGLIHHRGPCDLGPIAAALGTCRLESLDLSGLWLASRDLTEFLAAPCAETLTRLDLADTELAPAARPGFVRSRPALASLDLSGTPLAAFALEPLLASPALAGLRDLSISRCGSAANVVRALHGSPFWRQATALRLADGTVPTRLIEPLFAADGPAGLRTLDLSNNYLYDAGVADLCGATWAGNLTWLGLTSNYLTDDAAERVARSGRFPHLRTLHLSYNHTRDDDFAGSISDRGVVALASSPGLANLRTLALTGVSLTAAGVDALVNGPFWQLAGLGLGHCDLTPEAVRVLAASPGLARLSFLDLKWNQELGGDALRPLAESPYLSPLLELEVRGTGAGGGVCAELRRRLGHRFGG